MVDNALFASTLPLFALLDTMDTHGREYLVFQLEWYG